MAENEKNLTPYASYPSHCFWRRGVAEAYWKAMPDLYCKKFDLSPPSRIAQLEVVLTSIFRDT